MEKNHNEEGSRMENANFWKEQGAIEIEAFEITLEKNFMVV